MISFTEAQALGWITPLLWPFLRALALLSALPLLGTRTVPARVRIALAALVLWHDFKRWFDHLFFPRERHSEP